MELAVAFELETGCKLPPVKNRFYAPPPEVPRNKPTTARGTPGEKPKTESQCTSTEVRVETAPLSQ
ncbi:hypothetical protein DIPPA_15076 [Diplonema papillatum]|nr:hypothetical protein DIPPA_11761 [Diplonema papillatum]KAJ9438838.1 hypothetical protein DIPPA_26749 [Diplonema papillatum]KAJ9441025.1 hypothetical protein DIPPA_15076 [Diplonema papillatum]